MTLRQSLVAWTLLAGLAAGCGGGGGGGTSGPANPQSIQIPAPKLTTSFTGAGGNAAVPGVVSLTVQNAETSTAVSSADVTVVYDTTGVLTQVNHTSFESSLSFSTRGAGSTVRLLPWRAGKQDGVQRVGVFPSPLVSHLLAKGWTWRGGGTTTEAFPLMASLAIPAGGAHADVELWIGYEISETSTRVLRLHADSTVACAHMRDFAFRRRGLESARFHIYSANDSRPSTRRLFVLATREAASGEDTQDSTAECSVITATGPKSGAVVEFTPQSGAGQTVVAVSDANGVARAPGLVGGCYRARVLAPGFRPAAVSVDASPVAPTRPTVTLTSTGASGALELQVGTSVVVMSDGVAQNLTITNPSLTEAVFWDFNYIPDWCIASARSGSLAPNESQTISLRSTASAYECRATVLFATPQSGGAPLPRPMLLVGLTASDSDAIRRDAAAGLETLAFLGPDHVDAAPIALHDGAFYVVARNSATLGYILRVPVQGGAPDCIAHYSKQVGGILPTSVAVGDDGSVYVSDNNAPEYGTERGAVLRLPPGDRSIKVLAVAPLGSAIKTVQCQGAATYFLQSPSDYSSGTIYRAGSTPTTPQSIATIPGLVRSFEIIGNVAYCVGENGIWSVDLATGGAQQVINTGSAGVTPWSMAVDAGYAYLTGSGSPPSVSSVPLHGGTLRRLATLTPAEGDVVGYSANHVYYFTKEGAPNQLAYVKRVPAWGGTTDLLATRQLISNMLLTDDTLVWTEFKTDRYRRSRVMRLSTQRGGVALPAEPPTDPLPEPDDLPSVPPEPPPPPRPPPTEPPPGTDYEPPEPFSDDDDFGDAPLVATAIPFATRVSGRIDRERDMDCFSFPVRKNYKYRIRVYARSLDNPLVLLVDGSAEPKTLGFNDDAEPGVDLSADLRWTATFNGTAYAVVAAHGLVETGTYRIRVDETAPTSGGGGTPTPPPSPPAPQNLRPAGSPDVVIIGFSGHQDLPAVISTVQNVSYLEESGHALPVLRARYEANNPGKSAWTYGFVDGLSGDTSHPGFLQAIDRLRQIRDTWVKGFTNPTLVYIVGHSHGGNWAHLAADSVRDLPIEVLIDLDTFCSSALVAQTVYSFEAEHGMDIANFKASSRDRFLALSEYLENPCDSVSVSGLINRSIDDIVPANVRFNLEVNALVDSEENFKLGTGSGVDAGIYRAVFLTDGHGGVYKSGGYSLDWVVSTLRANVWK